MPLSTSNNVPRTEAPRARDIPATPATAVTGADRDPSTGRFKPGNQASRRRALRRIGKRLTWLRDDQLAPWAAPYAQAARQHAADLAADVGVLGALASPLAEECAAARLVARALLQLGLAGDMDALAESRQWLREARQGALTLEAMARSRRAEQPGTSPLHAMILSAGDKDPAP